jgi:hypothetical protein
VNRRSIVIVGASTVVVAGLVTAGIAHARSADEDVPAGQPHGMFGLTVTPHGGAPTTVALSCDPLGGNHPHPAEACADLAKVDGQIGHIQPRTGEMCPTFIAPVHAQAVGRWGSTPVDYDRTWGNACELRRATGAVFAFAY